MWGKSWERLGLLLDEKGGSSLVSSGMILGVVCKV